jgi:L-aspartate oxidase
MTTDVLIIGCGIAGATAALRVARNPSRRITLLSASDDPLESNTGLAQGGIVAVADDDTALAGDILRASGHTASLRATAVLTAHGGRLLREILGATAPVPFDRGSDGALRLGLEGGHSRRRIAHVADGTGRSIAGALLAAVARHPNIELRSATTAIDLITTMIESTQGTTTRCDGAWTLDRSGVLRPLTARATIIATGGLAANYLHTTNPRGARGDGIAMAARAGARTAGLEYVQFHPTALALDDADNFLISEAVRGEGAVLVDPAGRTFMHAYAPHWGDLAPRDIVARAIDEQMRLHGARHVYLDLASRMSAERILARFPAIAARSRRHGIDITREPIPVRPAAHYTCGGIVVDECGRSSVRGLYAIGEASNTGLHGANRLASTSLLEGLVWGATAADDIERELALDRCEETPEPSSRPPIYGADDGAIAPLPSIDERTARLRELMWHDVGIIRTAASLERAIGRLERMRIEIAALIASRPPDVDTFGLRNAVEAGLLVARGSLRRRESRGCHFRVDGAAAESTAPLPFR